MFYHIVQRRVDNSKRVAFSFIEFSFVDKEVHLQHLMMADLLVQDRSGTIASAIIAGCVAEKFFGTIYAYLQVHTCKFFERVEFIHELAFSSCCRLYNG